MSGLFSRAVDVLRREALVVNAAALMASTAATAVIGLGFWTLSTHLTNPSIVGRASAWISAMVLLAGLSEFSFASLFQRYLPTRGFPAGRFVAEAYAISFVTGIAAASVTIALGFTSRFLPDSWYWRVFFAFAVGIWTTFDLQDSALISLRKSRLVPLENVGFSAMKFALLPILLAVDRGRGIVIAWVCPTLLAVVAINWYIFRRLLPSRTESARVARPPLRELVTLTAAQYAAVLINLLSTSLVTLIILSRLGAAASGYYFTCMQIATAPGLFLWAVSRSFLVESVHHPDDLAHLTRRAIATVGTITVLGLAVGLLVAPYVLEIFGHVYAVKDTGLLRLQLLSLPGSAVGALITTFAWIDKRVWWITVREVLSVTIYLGVLFALISHVGLLAPGFASLAFAVIELVFFLPSLWRRVATMREGAQPAP